MIDNSTLTKSIFNTKNSTDDIIKYRLQLLKYLDTVLYEKDEYFFYNLLEYSRFIYDSNPKTVAYTTNDGLIYMNAPCAMTPADEKENWQWDFVYAHECLHQIYDTFSVGDLIIQELGKDKYDHYLLNVASDCVINETLMRRFKKKSPKDLITAKYIKTKYNVPYDLYEDTQFSMYMKLFNCEEEVKRRMKSDELLKRAIDIHEKNKQSGQGQEGQEGQGEGQGQGQEGQGEGQEGQGEGQEGQGQEGQGQEGQEGQGQEGQEEGKGGTYSDGKFGEYKELLEYYDSEPGQSLKDIINKSKNTLTGPLGEFITKLSKIPSQIKKTKYGINIKTDNGSKTDYMKELFTNTKLILNNKLRKLRKYKSSYSRVNRRKPFSDSGMINKGRTVIKDKVDLTLSFYVDISGSMEGTVEPIFQNLYSNDKSISQQYKASSKDLINDIIFNYYAFNENISPVKNKKIPRVSGGNVSLDELLHHIKINTETSLINVIITDAGFPIDNQKVINEWKENDGFLIIITNDVSRWKDYNKIQQQSNGKIISIATDSF